MSNGSRSLPMSASSSASFFSLTSASAAASTTTLGGGNAVSPKVSLDDVPNREAVFALWIADIADPDKKDAALRKLSDALPHAEDLPIADWIWNAFGVVTALIGELTSRVPKIFQPALLTDEDALAICYTLNVMTTLVRSDSTKNAFIDASLSAYILPLLKLNFGVAPSTDAIISQVLVILRTVVQTIGVRGVQHMIDLGAWSFIHRTFVETTFNSPVNVAAGAILDSISNVVLHPPQPAVGFTVPDAVQSSKMAATPTKKRTAA